MSRESMHKTAKSLTRGEKPLERWDCSDDSPSQLP